ncbi:helix-turn-helix transcriptional regulator [Celeribacter baekdonensis]|uniref:Regulatory protein LuxR n=2 Tax=Roseobacteraceae TaxID=2854170 RepID=K2J916_9RHOB|nr:helix-turn-helix transcriptional regulator [Celeribacter baekdonensis]EKE71728.1 regulatory protein LuxR [Celeribacter baekdonensis B30]|tara:strand:- start:4833 stop:5525 length:693 start_codon:yes stop_codon:yes gene_type:complete
MASIPQLVDAAFAACPEGALGLIYDYAATPFSSDPAKFALPDVIEARGGAERLVADWCGQALYRTDPVQNVAAGITRPFSWSYHPQEPSVIARDLERAEVGEVSERLLGWALARGITVPLHLPAQGFATITVFLPDGARAQTILADFALAAHRLQDQLTPVLPQLRNPLSPREAECLSLTANGLSAKQIAYALDRSESMVVKHLQAAGVKLGARNRSHAVAIATRQRWIS